MSDMREASDNIRGLSDARRRAITYKETAVSDTPWGVKISDYTRARVGSPCGTYKRCNRGLSRPNMLGGVR